MADIDESIAIDEDVIEEQTSEQQDKLGEKLDLIEERCKKSKVGFERIRDFQGMNYGVLMMPNGRESRRIIVHNEAMADSVISIEFEKFSILKGFDALCCYDDGTIEASLRSTSVGVNSIIRRLSGRRVPYSEPMQPIVIGAPENLLGHPDLQLGIASDEMAVLLGRRSSRISLKLTKSRAKTQEQAIKELRQYADSLFFQIDQILGNTFILERESQRRPLPIFGRRPLVSLEYPKASYNQEALSLYWYAKSASEMPLLRFLAFYQSIEFYFPRYSQIEARRRIGALLKSPQFRPYQDDDIDRLIAILGSARSGGLGSERVQLRAVVNECMSAEELRNFISGNEKRLQHFSSKSMRYHKIPVSNPNLDLRTDVADRLYDIRCKIVHTKNENTEEDISMILPFSDEAEYLSHDIDLAEYVASRVLIFSSREIATA